MKDQYFAIEKIGALINSINRHYAKNIFILHSIAELEIKRSVCVLSSINPLSINR